jgi:hypothetical protein
MGKKEKNSMTEGKDIMRLIVSPIHLILIRVNNLETCAHMWGLTNSHARICRCETWKDNHGLFFVCLLCGVFDDLSSVIPSTYQGMTEQKCIKNGKGVDARCRAVILDITQEFVGKGREQPRRTSVNTVGVTVETQTVNLTIKVRKVTSWATLLEDKQMKGKLCVRVWPAVA